MILVLIGVAECGGGRDGGRVRGWMGMGMEQMGRPLGWLLLLLLLLLLVLALMLLVIKVHCVVRLREGVRLYALCDKQAENRDAKMASSERWGCNWHEKKGREHTEPYKTDKRPNSGPGGCSEDHVDQCNTP